MTSQTYDRLIDLTLAELGPKPASRNLRWTRSEINFLKAHLDWTDVQIGETLGRSPTGVKIKRQRIFQPVVSKAPGWLSANKARERLGMSDTRPVIGWIQKGLIDGKPVGVTCQQRWILPQDDLQRFVSDPVNWIYFNKDRVKDPELRRSISLAGRRFKDEWLTTRRAADLLGLTTKDITRCIQLGRLHGVQAVNRDGRKHVHAVPRWSFWYVLRSEALAMPPIQPRGRAQSGAAPENQGG
jgi:hypothetical protein